MTEPTPSRLVSPTLLLGICAWLLPSWFINVTLDSASLIGGGGVAFAPAARGMLISMTFGAMLAWPAWRLSQRPHRVGGLQIVTDLLCLLLMAQLVIWPLRFGARWTLEQTAMISLTFIVWLIAVALIVWAGWIGRTVIARTFAMLGCIALPGGGYLVALLTGYGAAMTMTPLTMLWLLAHPDPGRPLPDLSGELLTLLIAVVLGLAMVLHARGRLHPDRRPGIMNEVPNSYARAGVSGMQFITAEEKAQLEQRLEEFRARRPQIVDRIAEARALGDLKENAEYHAAREEQGMVEAEIRRLEERLKNATVADDVELPEDMVFLGATVKLRDVDSEDEDLYRLVGEASGSFDADVIEVTAASPMGEALMKARVGQTVRVDLPRGTKRFEILEIV